jgi:hypothetical protein
MRKWHRKSKWFMTGRDGRTIVGRVFYEPMPGVRHEFELSRSTVAPDLDGTVKLIFEGRYIRPHGLRETIKRIFKS